jgi:DNA (cytosine-5)-methyltransferase 1
MQIRAVPSAVRAIDLFAGWGGFTQGAEEAGAQVVYAANHWPLAVRAHAANHPARRSTSARTCRQADWTRLPRYDLLLASPACQGHSTRRRKLEAPAPTTTPCARPPGPSSTAPT